MRPNIHHTGEHFYKYPVTLVKKTSISTASVCNVYSDNTGDIGVYIYKVSGGKVPWTTIIQSTMEYHDPKCHGLS